MVYSTCCEWFHDWIAEHPPSLVDEYDLATWMNEEMTHATDTFISHAFHTPRGRGDALVILRALYYEYAQLRMEAARAALVADESAAPRLRTALQTPQKTAAWHAESRDVLSGHEFGSLIVGSTGEYIQAMAKKCAPPSPFIAGADAEVEEQIVFLTPPDGLSPFKWGWRYEPVARALFERCFAGGAVDDSLGRVRHSSLPGLGASPDGVIVDGPCAGRLVELKCPVSRVLDDNIPPRYWVQMQLQAEVCDVEAVEYFEVVIATGSVPATTALPWIGKVCVIAPYMDAPWTSYKYEYSPLFPLEGAESLEEWVPSTDGVVLESQTWWVRDYRRRTVLRNRRWWANVGAPAYTTFWRDVIAARADGRFASRPMFITDSSTVASKRDDTASDDQESISPWSVCDDQT
jgi:hypothetical protein